MTRRLSAKAARQVIETARLEKAPDWPETRRWHVVAGDLLLAVIEPAYQGARRNGWRWRLADHAGWNSRHERTRENAAVAALGAWERWITNKENS